MTWWIAEARSRHAYLAAGLLALTLYLVVFGPGHMFGTSVYWDLPQEDQRAYLMAYRYWLHEPWHWPLFSSTTMNLPDPKNIAFSDAIPAWAFVNKTLATLIPPWGDFTVRAYLGLWYALVYVLQACLGVVLLRALGHRSWGATIITALFFLAVPAWVVRYGHAALTAHFLFLWALLLYLRPGHKWIWLVQLAVTALVNPYHTVMSLGVFVASLLRTRSLRSFATWFPLGVLAVAIAAWLAGYFSPEANTPMWGFTSGSTNVLSMFVPMRSGLFGDGRWLATVVATDYQYEGWAYLGIGLLIVLGVAWSQPRSIVAAIRCHPFLFAIALAFWILALSNHVYFGGHRVLAYKVPSLLRWIPTHFRAPGRFVWVPMYIGITFALSAALHRFKSGWRLAILPVLVVLQLLDARGDWGWPLHFTNSRMPAILDLDAWRPLVNAHDTVLVNPSYDCVTDGDPSSDHVGLELQWLASEHAIPINGVYTSRPTRPCSRDTRALRELAPRDGTLYIFLFKLAWLSRPFDEQGATCGEFAYGRACSLDRPAIADAIRRGALTAPTPTKWLAPTLHLGQRIELATAVDPAYVLDGWSSPETLGRWTDGPLANLVLQMPDAPRADVTLKLQAMAMLCGDRTTQAVDVSIAGSQIATLAFAVGSNDPATVRSIPVPIWLEAAVRGVVVLELRPHDVLSPTRLHCDKDDRQLGIRVQRLWFE